MIAVYFSSDLIVNYCHWEDKKILEKSSSFYSHCGVIASCYRERQVNFTQFHFLIDWTECMDGNQWRKDILKHVSLFHKIIKRKNGKQE